MRANVLVINCGSSSVKYELIDIEQEQVLASGLADRIGVATEVQASISYERPGEAPYTVSGEFPSHQAAVSKILELLTDKERGVIAGVQEIAVVGHRVVHGGDEFTGAVLITPEVMRAVERWADLAPLHNPPNLQGIRACAELIPGVPAVAVFDTAFHASMPREAYLYAIPREWVERFALRRYGFHGTSHHYVYLRAEEYLRGRGVEAASARVITCHLGNGCSMAAVRAGAVLDTSMGFTPLEGLVMGTRSGDVDPAIVGYLNERLGISAEEVVTALNKKSGLLGLSGSSSDMRDLLTRRAQGDQRAREAIAVYCYRIKKYIGAYAVALGGVEALVFTAGVGEHSADIREQVCEGLGVIGLWLDQEANRACKGFADIATAESRGRILVIPTNEELMIARQALQVARDAAQGRETAA